MGMCGKGTRPTSHHAQTSFWNPNGNGLKYLLDVVPLFFVWVYCSLTPSSSWVIILPPGFLRVFILPLFMENLLPICWVAHWVLGIWHWERSDFYHLLLTVSRGGTFLWGCLLTTSLMQTSVTALTLWQLFHFCFVHLMRVSFLDHLHSWGFRNVQGTNSALSIFRVLGR